MCTLILLIVAGYIAFKVWTGSNGKESLRKALLDGLNWLKNKVEGK